jgi:hypothetical protein
LIRHGDCDGPGVGEGDRVGHGVLGPFSAMRQPPAGGRPSGGTVGRGHGDTLPATSRVKQPGAVLGPVFGVGVAHGPICPALPTKHPLCDGFGVPVVGDRHGAGVPPLVEIRQPCDGPAVGATVGVGHGTGPFGLDTRQLALDEGAGVAPVVGVGHGAAVAPVLTRHDGVGLGTATAPLTRPGAMPGSVAFPTPPAPPQAAVSVTIAMPKPSRRIPWTPIARDAHKKP